MNCDLTKKERKLCPHPCAYSKLGGAFIICEKLKGVNENANPIEL